MCQHLLASDEEYYWEPNVLGGLMAQINQDNLDVLRFNYRNVHEDGLAFNPYKVNKPECGKLYTIGMYGLGRYLLMAMASE